VAKHAVVTGGNRGIGLAIASALAASGARVSVVSRSGVAHGAGAGLFHATADISDETQIAAAFAACRQSNGPIEILVNNSGIAQSAPLGRTSTEMWNRIIATNLTGTFLCTREALADMIPARWGRIVNVASIAGLYGAAYIGAYSASKHGVVGLTRSLAEELREFGITANALCPGYVETDMMQQAIDNIVKHTRVTPEAAREQLAQSNPGGRIVHVDEVAAAAMALIEGDATGECVVLPPLQVPA
jgi:NAD(P)-dependent dehydrogenase (short-subunit alcohol dehydrogenase family)